MRVIIGAFVPLVTFLLPLTGQEHVRNTLRADIVGCYALFTGTGKRVDSAFYRASPLVHLDSTMSPVFRAHREFSARRLLIRLDAEGHPLDVVDPSPHLGPMWWADSLSDSLRLTFTDGFSGTFLALTVPRARLDTLRGRIEEHWDFRPPTKRGPAYAIRVPCNQ